MSNRTKVRARANRQNKNLTNDSFQNLIARVGQGTANQASGGGYGFSPVSRNRTQLEYAYRSSWLAGKAVDAFAEDMTREGVEVKCDLPPEDLETLDHGINSLAIWDRIKSNAKWSRLYGGSIAVLMIDGQAPETPLNFDRIGLNQFRGLMVLDRWVVQPSLTELVTEFNMHMGQPKYYDVTADAQGMTSQRIHYSRVIRLDGVELPYWQRIAENGWGQSILERLWDRLLAFDSTTEGAAQLVYKAHLRTYAVDGLREIIAAGGKAFEGLTKQIDLIRAYQSNEGLTLMDAKDKFEAHAYSFAGLSDMLMQFGQQLSGAMDIPLVRLFGQSPAGLNATGESDMRTYYDSIKQQQESKLRDGIERIYKCAFPSFLDMPMPEDFSFKFRSLWQIDDTQKAEIATSVTTAVNTAFESGLLPRHIALKELKQSSEVTGIYTNITKEDIKEAEEEPPPDMNETDTSGLDGAEDPAKKLTSDADFDESKHPRANNGQFGSGGGSGKEKSKPSQHKHLEGSFYQSDVERLPKDAQKEFTRIYQQAAANKDHFDATNARIAKALGGDAIVVPIKGSGRAADKVLRDYDGDPSKVKDLLRTTISVKSMGDTSKAIESLVKEYGEPVKNRNLLDPNVDSLGGTGYRDANLVFKVNGSYAEVQINLPEMLEAKHEAHEYYVRNAGIELKAKQENRALTAKERKEVDSNIAKQLAAYNSAWQSITRGGG